MSTSSSKVITSLQNQKVKELVSLRQKKERDLRHQFLIEGEHLIQEAIKTNRLCELYVSESYQGNISFKNTTIISDTVAQKLSQTSSKSNIFGLCEMKEGSLDHSYYLMCDDIQDPGNLGTLIRSVVSFGWDGIIVSNHSADFYNDKCVRASQGSLFYSDLIRGDLTELIPLLKQNNLKIYGTDVNEATPLSQIEKQPMAVVLGNEGQGLSSEVKELCDDYIIIETSNFESLNVGVAGSIILYELKKR